MDSNTRPNAPEDIIMSIGAGEYCDVLIIVTKRILELVEELVSQTPPHLEPIGTY